jgi:hypothetical protein
MYLLSEKQVAFILNDLILKGVERDDLRMNLLDHICCILEEELTDEQDFESVYESVLRRFYQTTLDEIEEETKLLLTFKHFYTMKKIMIISGILSASILGLGILFKFLYFPGTAFLISVGILMLSLVFLPLYFTLKAKEEKQTREKILIALTSLVCISISLATLFKVMYWPGANALGITAVGILGLLFLPVYFISGIRNPENKVNTILSSVLIIAGCGLFLTLARSPKGTERHQKSITEQLIRSEMILKSESEMLGKVKSVDTNLAAFQLTQFVENLKSALVLQTTGCPQLTHDNSCNASLVSDEPMNPNVFGNNALLSQEQRLSELIVLYNQSLQKGQHSLPQQTFRTESVASVILYLIQLQTFVLQNERALLASN